MARKSAPTTPRIAVKTWECVSRAALAAERQTTSCVLCDEGATWQWQIQSPKRKTPDIVPFCDAHRDQVRPRADDPTILEGCSTRSASPKVITRGDIREVLHHCHWIPALRGWRSPGQRRFGEYTNGELVALLKMGGVLVKGQHFTGYVPAKNVILAAVFLGGTWRAVFRSGTTKTRIVTWHQQIGVCR